MNAKVLRLDSRTGSAVACVFVLLLCSLEVAATSRWSEERDDFQAGAVLNLNNSGVDLRLAANPGHPANWTGVLDGAAGPFNAYGFAMACDEAADKLVLFGAGTWTYDLATGNWSQLAAGGPTSRNQAAMVYDKTSGLVVLFGGYEFSSQTGPRYFNDTWVYDVTADQWTQRFPAGAPPPRCRHTMSIDPSGGVIVLFGGEVYDGSLSTIVPKNDTWIYNISADTWTARSPADNPPARSRHATTHDAATREMVLFGGWGGLRWNGTAYVTVQLGDTWTYDIAADLWTNRTGPGSPQARSEHSMIFDPATTRTVLFGGRGERGLLGDTWTYASGTYTWTNRTSAGSPSPQCVHSMAFDPTRHLTMLFSGRNERGNISETWSYDSGLNRWANLAPRTCPSPRSDHAMAYDTASGDVILFGGNFAWGHSNDVWRYNSSSNTWSPLGPSSPMPSARQGHSMVYDTRNGLMVLFGGQDAGGVLDDTWTFNPSTNTWTKMNPPSSPQPRTAHSMVYDVANGEALLFGGQTVQYSPYNVILLGDTWTYNVTTNSWSQKSALPAPSARYGQAMAYDSSRRTAVLFGGVENGGLMGDTWTRNSTTGLWMNMTPQPSPRKGFDYAMAYGGPSCDVLLFGGWDGSVSAGGGTSSCHPYPSETWTYRASTNTWTNRSHPSMPSARFSSAMAYDVSRNAIITFGGYSYQNALGDTWLYGSRAFFAQGTYTSQPFDTGGTAYFGALEWNATIPAGTSIRFQAHAADSPGNLSVHPYTGPGGTTSSYHDTSGQYISSACNGSRWIQYRAYLKTDNVSVTPELKNVTINYNLLQSVSLLSPAGGENWTGNCIVKWTASDQDNDGLVFDLYLVEDQTSAILASGLTDLNGSWGWDTSSVPNGTYRLRITSRDNSTSIPLEASATSPWFTILHPAPPNHVPAVTLLSPANNSVLGNRTVQLRWRGEDADLDVLIYNLTYSMLVDGNWTGSSVTTRNTFFNITIPGERVSCYWNVTAFDGKDRSLPSPVWRFDVNLSVPNRLPIITSTAPANATVAAPYMYLLTAEDPDNDTLTYTLLSRPDGMSLGSFLPNRTGVRIHWTPTMAQRGDQNATVEVTDGRGGRAVQDFTIHVVAVRPVCNITSPYDGAVVKGSLMVSGTAAAGSPGLARVEVRVDGGKWEVAGGTLSWTFRLDTTKLGNGNHTIEARATDGELDSGPAMVHIIVKNPPPTPKTVVTTLDGFPWLILAIVLGAAAAAMFLMFKGKKK